MKIFQLFDRDENTWYVQATEQKQAVQFIEETFQVSVEHWAQMTFLPVNTTIHVAYERNIKSIAAT